MYKLDLEKAEEPEIKLEHSLTHRKSKRIPEKKKKKKNASDSLADLTV